MNEEIRKNAEISDDELEQVSGGNVQWLEDHAPDCPVCGVKMRVMGFAMYYYYVCEPCRQQIFIDP